LVTQISSKEEYICFWRICSFSVKIFSKHEYAIESEENYAMNYKSYKSKE